MRLSVPPRGTIARGGDYIDQNNHQLSQRGGGQTNGKVVHGGVGDV